MKRDYLRAYSFHGVFSIPENYKDAMADCRFCGEMSHFSIEMATGLFRCFKCERRGNLYVFLRYLWEHLLRENWRDPSIGWKRLRSLAVERGIPVRTLKDRGLVWDPIERHWIIPIFAPAENPDGTPNAVCDRKLVNLKRWINYDGKLQLRGTPTCATHLFNWDRVVGVLRQSYGISLHDFLHVRRGSDSRSPASLGPGLRLRGERILSVEPRRPVARILVGEGEWDALALLGHLDAPDSPLIVGCPGADSWKREWLPLLFHPGISWDFLFDHDDAGLAGYTSIMDRLAREHPTPALASMNLRFLIWDRHLPDGYDIRDHGKADPENLLPYIDSHLRRRKLPS